MEKISIWVFFFPLLLLFNHSVSVEQDVITSLLGFFDQLSGGVRPTDPSFGWNSSSDPCFGNWTGISCTDRFDIKKVALEGLTLRGSLDMNPICSIDTLLVVSVKNNSINGEIPEDISNCRHLTQMYFNDNLLSGSLPQSMSHLNNLKRLDISNNNFSGELPDFPKISGLITFLAQDNVLTGQIPEFDFENLQEFNVSFNNFSGPVPNLDGRFGKSSLIGNALLCGKPLDTPCPPSPPSKKSKSKTKIVEKLLMFLGYILLAAIILFFIISKLVCTKKVENKEVKEEIPKELNDAKNLKPNSGSSTGYKSASRSEYSLHSSIESASMASPSLVVLTRSPVKGLRFEDLLKAPAELLGRGRYGSLYKVVFEDGSNLAVKRIKDWAISNEEFETRMKKIDQVKHPNVLPPVAFYCSKQEKLVVYEYQQNGSLFKLLHGNQSGLSFNWGSRLNLASTLASALAFLHKELGEVGIAHGNLKSSNIMMNSNMEPCVSEYGLMVVEGESLSQYNSMNNAQVKSYNTFMTDVYNFGVILLELLTGKQVQNNGSDLARWVHSVVREEWTVEVFDKALFIEGASEERMVYLLQVAVKCINPSPDARPNLTQIADMISTIREEEESSIAFEA